MSSSRWKRWARPRPGSDGSPPPLEPHGYLLCPVLELGLAKSFRGLLRELETHAEQGMSAATLPQPA